MSATMNNEQEPPRDGETRRHAEQGRHHDAEQKHDRDAQQGGHREREHHGARHEARRRHDHRLHDPSLYLNRELSWLDFNERVLQLAEDETTPLLERVKFCAIYTTNLDEYYMVRVAGLHDQIDAGVENPSQDGLTPSEAIAAIHERVLELEARLSSCFEERLRPVLSEQGVNVVGFEQLDDRQRAYLAQHFRRVIFPALTPLAVAPGRPFPYISNLSLSLAVLVRDPSGGETVFARVKVPTEILPRFVTVRPADAAAATSGKPGRDPSEPQPSGPPSAGPANAGAGPGTHNGAGGVGTTLVPLEDVIAHHLDALFPGMEIVDYDVFRVTRDADLEVSDDAADLLQAVEDELRRRRFGEIVRVEVGASCSERLREELVGLLGVREDEVYPVAGLLDMGALWQIVKLPGMPELRHPPFVPVTHPRLLRHEGERPDVFAAMREGDVLVHHPYDSFATSVERFVEQAVADPNVLAIKQTVYRTSDDSPLVPDLIAASERGKQAVALVELTARFDERMNIHWAKALEEAGVHVVYGQPALKTHAKCVLVVRREGDGVRNYVHIGTGNYHSATARLYTDFGLFTTCEEIGADVADMFNNLTGYGRPLRYRKVLIAPAHLREGLIAEIDATIAAHTPESPGRIRMKMNALVDGHCIRALYRASRAGVQVDLNVRGICCLRPGVPGISENIRVVSVVGRLLEHSRVYTFERGGEHTVYIASADLMPRNLDHRVELAAPIESLELQAELMDTLERAFADNQSSWELQDAGAWRRRSPGPGERLRNMQIELMELHSRRAAEARPAEREATSEPATR
ncbi:MAG TPA: polyphosphate kinase 1 [Solirubrobacteraceae bacterium]|nr:polyphosphate kinase 1 [Solirubrobacteraceae bacterium]